MTEVSTYTVTLYVAGDCESAKRWLRRECYERGLCVTVTPTTFLYTGGEETGFALDIAKRLTPELCQRSCLLVASDRTGWLTFEPPGVSRGA